MICCLPVEGSQVGLSGETKEGDGTRHGSPSMNSGEAMLLSQEEPGDTLSA